MSRNLRLALLTATAFAFTAIPPLLPAPVTAGLSGSALAAASINGSRSNTLRTKGRVRPTGNGTQGGTSRATTGCHHHIAGGGTNGTLLSFASCPTSD